MGNFQTQIPNRNFSFQQTDLVSELMPIQQGCNENQMLGLGRFQIYRFKTPPYEIVMKNVRIFACDNPKCKEYCQMAIKIGQGISHKNIAKIHSINICNTSNFCLKQVSIESFVNCYAINLQQIIDKRKTIDVRFTTGELFYILNSLIELACYLKNLQIHFGIFLPKNIFLSPQGFIKVYLNHLTSNNKHFIYHHMICAEVRDMHKFLPIPPQCLSFIKHVSPQLLDINLQKLDVFGIGMVAIEAILFHSTRLYYKQQYSQGFSLVFDDKQLMADLKQIESIYPSKLVCLIQKMIRPNPKQRCSLLYCRQYISSIRNDISINGCVKIMQDDSSDVLPKISYHSNSKKQECKNILKNITNNGYNKLVYVPFLPINNQKQTNIKRVKHLKISQEHRNSSVKTTRKLHKLTLSKASYFTAEDSICQNKAKSLDINLEYLSSFKQNRR